MRGTRILLSLLGLLFSTVPPLAAVLTYFPLWSHRGGGAVLSGITVLLFLLCLLPLYKLFKEHLRSPSAPTVWLLVFLVFFALAEIADEVKVIALAGFAGNLVGTVLFRLARKLGKEDGGEGRV